MDEQTINATDNFLGSDSTTEQPNESNEAPVQATNEQPDSQDEASQIETTPAEDAEEPDGVQVDDKAIVDFLAKKGLDVDKLDNPKEAILKLGKMALNSERSYKSGTQEIAALKRQLESIAAMQNQPNGEPQAQQADFDINANNEVFLGEVSAWSEQKSLSPEEEKLLVDWLSVPVGQNPIDGTPIMRIHMVANKTLTLDDAYRAAGCASAKSEAIKASMRQEVEKELAAKQAAKRPSGSATDSTQFAKPSSDSDAFLVGFNSH